MLFNRHVLPPNSLIQELRSWMSFKARAVAAKEINSAGLNQVYTCSNVHLLGCELNQALPSTTNPNRSTTCGNYVPSSAV